MTVIAKVSLAAQPLVGDERDEILSLVSRIKKADDRTRTADNAAKPIPVENLKWAEDWKLPAAVFDYFELEQAA